MPLSTAIDGAIELPPPVPMVVQWLSPGAPVAPPVDGVNERAVSWRVPAAVAKPPSRVAPTSRTQASRIRLSVMCMALQAASAVLWSLDGSDDELSSSRGTLRSVNVRVLWPGA